MYKCKNCSKDQKEFSKISVEVQLRGEVPPCNHCGKEIPVRKWVLFCSLDCLVSYATTNGFIDELNYMQENGVIEFNNGVKEDGISK